MQRVKRGNVRATLSGRTGWFGVSVPRATMRDATASLLPLAQPKGVLATVRFAWACARAAWACARAASAGSS